MNHFADNSRHHSLCAGPGILKLSLQSPHRHAQEMENLCQALLAQGLLVPKRTGDLYLGLQKDWMFWDSLGGRWSLSLGQSSG